MQGEHIVPVCLGPILRSAVIKYMGKHDLDKQYACLCLITKSLRSEGLLSDEDYCKCLTQYSKTISSMIKKNPDLVLTPSQLQEKQKLEEMQRHFSMVIDQWHLHESKDWRVRELDRAKGWVDRVPNAKLVVALGER